jgi:hypothetical protein
MAVAHPQPPRLAGGPIAAVAAERRQGVSRSQHLPDAEIEALAELLEAMGGGPTGAGGYYVEAVLGMLGTCYTGRNPAAFDLARILGLLMRSRMSARRTQLAEAASRKDPPS